MFYRTNTKLLQQEIKKCFWRSKSLPVLQRNYFYNSLRFPSLQPQHSLLQQTQPGQQRGQAGNRELTQTAWPVLRALQVAGELSCITLRSWWTSLRSAERVSGYSRLLAVLQPAPHEQHQLTLSIG